MNREEGKERGRERERENRVVTHVFTCIRGTRARIYRQPVAGAAINVLLVPLAVFRYNSRCPSSSNTPGWALLPATVDPSIPLLAFKHWQSRMGSEDYRWLDEWLGTVSGWVNGKEYLLFSEFSNKIVYRFREVIESNFEKNYCIIRKKLFEKFFGSVSFWRILK